MLLIHHRFLWWKTMQNVEYNQTIKLFRNLEAGSIHWATWDTRSANKVLVRSILEPVHHARTERMVEYCQLYLFKTTFQKYTIKGLTTTMVFQTKLINQTVWLLFRFHQTRQTWKRLHHNIRHRSSVALRDSQKVWARTVWITTGAKNRQAIPEKVFVSASHVTQIFLRQMTLLEFCFQCLSLRVSSFWRVLLQHLAIAFWLWTLS